MTNEDIECITKWFSHIEQLATDGKTANGFEMPIDRLLATIKVVAKDSREYVEKFCKTSEKLINGLDVTDFCKPIDPGIAQCIADHSWAENK